MKLRIDFTSKIAHIKDIEERNSVFDSLSDEDKRKEIAWDAIQLVLSKKVLASQGHYWSDNLHFIDALDPREYQRILNNELPNCSCCQRGLIMVSTIRLGNTIGADNPYKSEGNDPTILKGFTITEMEEMENEYEYGEFEHPYEENTEEKLVNICCNIIQNGFFNTEDDSDYIY